MPTVAVFGLGWPTYGSPSRKGFGVGGWAVRAASEMGFSRVRAVARSPDKYAGFYAGMPNVEVVAGDVTKPETLGAVLDGMDAAIFAVQAPDGVSVDEVDRDGLINLAKECEARAVKLIVITAVGVSPKHAWNPVRLIMHVFIKARYYTAKWESEEYVRKQTKKTRWTIIRPGMLSEGDYSPHRVEISQADAVLFGFRAVSKADVGKLAAAAVADPASDFTTFEVQGGTKALGASTFSGLFAGLKKDAVSQ